MICTSGLSRSSSIRRIALRHFFQTAVSKTISLGLLAMPLVLGASTFPETTPGFGNRPGISLSYFPPRGRNVACRGDSEGGNGQRGSDAGGRSGCIRRRQRSDPGLEVEGAGGERPPDRWRRRAQAVLRDVPDWFWPPSEDN